MPANRPAGRNLPCAGLKDSAGLVAGMGQAPRLSYRSGTKLIFAGPSLLANPVPTWKLKARPHPRPARTAR